MDTYSAMRPTNFILKCFALNCIYKKDNKIVSSWSLSKNLIIILILCSINSVTFYYKIQKTDFKSNEFTFRDEINYVFIIGFLRYMVDLIYVRKYGTKECISYYCTFDKIDKILKMSYYNETQIISLKIMVLSCIFFIITIIFDGFAWYSIDDKFYISFIIEYFYTFATILIVLDMISHIVQIEYRLHTLGDIVEKLNRSDKEEPKCFAICLDLNSEATGLDISETFNVQGTENGTTHPVDILQISQSYLMLIEQTDFINTMFGFRVSI